IPRIRCLAAPADAWRPTAATVAACARSRPPSARTRATGSGWPVDSAPRRRQMTIPRSLYTVTFIYLSSHILGLANPSRKGITPASVKPRCGAISKPQITETSAQLDSALWAVDGHGEQVRLVAPDAMVVVLKDTGHWMMEENPKETTDALLKFL